MHASATFRPRWVWGTSLSFASSSPTKACRSRPPRVSPAKDDERTLRITGLSAGQYTLKSGGQTIAAATADQWSKGVRLHSGPDFEQEEQLRKVVVAKNAQYFNFWRPENDTYIFGYRKHEQGQNGVEIPRFIPFVEQDDAKDRAAARSPAAHVRADPRRCEVAACKRATEATSPRGMGRPARADQRETAMNFSVLIRFSAARWNSSNLPSRPPALPPNGDPDSQPDPEIERQSFKIADGFDIHLFAAIR